MNTLPVPAADKPQSFTPTLSSRRVGLWIAAAVALLLAAAVSFFGWSSLVKALPYALILACPAMHLFMCHAHKSRQSGEEAAPR